MARKTARRGIARALRRQRPKAKARVELKNDRTDQRHELFERLVPGALVQFKHPMSLVTNAYQEYGQWERMWFMGPGPAPGRQLAVYVGPTRVTHLSGKRRGAAVKVCLFAIGPVVAVADLLDIDIL